MFSSPAFVLFKFSLFLSLSLSSFRTQAKTNDFAYTCDKEVNYVVTPHRLALVALPHTSSPKIKEIDKPRSRVHTSLKEVGSDDALHATARHIRTLHAPELRLRKHRCQAASKGSSSFSPIFNYS